MAQPVGRRMPAPAGPRKASRQPPRVARSAGHDLPGLAVIGSKRIIRHMHAIRWTPGGPILPALLLALACNAPDGAGTSRFGGETDLWRRMLAAEDGRVASPAALGALRQGVRSADPELRREAIRAFGRLEQDSLVHDIVPALADLSAAVRAEAANALGQAVSRGDPAAAREALVERLDVETDPAVRAVIAETLGRLRQGSAGEAAATGTLLAALVEPAPETWLGLAKGFYFLVRQRVARGALSARVVDRIRGLTVYAVPGADTAVTLTAARVRRLAVAALVSAGEITIADIDAALDDADPFVRREAAAGLPALAARPAAARLAARALDDAAPAVRLEAVRALPRAERGNALCAALLGAMLDEDTHVALLAIDAAGPASCRNAAARLDSLTGALPAAGPDTGWHHAAHAIVSLATLDRARGRDALPDFAGHGDPFVRTYAARAAGVLEDGATLRALAADPSPNVRSAAVEGLRTLEGHRADSVYIAELALDDSQLLQAAAAALEGSRDPAALPALLDAFDRVSLARRETWRDSRRALLERIHELGGPAAADRVQPYLSDYDREIAELVADMLGDWTGERTAPAPGALPRLELPDLAQLEVLERAEAVIEMSDGGRIVLRLLPFEAPTNVWRFASMARDGRFDGRMFHRVVPNFVIQGGSPSANEYTGEGEFTRDELGLASNWRGTVGLSTRGRDTGDGQIYINLIDNTRLDHDYTVFAEVVSGMDVVDRLLEGARIRTVSIAAR